MMEQRADFMERHYTLGELAKAWHMSRATLHGWFSQEEGVIKYGVDKLKRGRKRIYVSLRVPEHVARRVYQRRTGREVYPAKGN
jgi:hypothetical protein